MLLFDVYAFEMKAMHQREGPNKLEIAGYRLLPMDSRKESNFFTNRITPPQGIVI